MSDVDYYQSSGMTRQEAIAQVAADRGSTKLLFAFFIFFFRLFVLFFLFLPGIFCAYLLLRWLKGPLGDPSGWNYFFWMAGTVYVLECLLFFLKGWHFRLKERDNRLWILLWSICAIYCFALPVLMMQGVVSEELIHSARHVVTSRLVVMSWISGLILGGIIYWRYKIHQDTAPAWFFWAYRLGRGAGPQA